MSRAREFRDDLPRVLRPDLVLTEQGYTIAELDNVPGGIGLTGWLNQTYAALGEDVIGGAAGMIDGFRSILPEGRTSSYPRRPPPTGRRCSGWPARRARATRCAMRPPTNRMPQPARRGTCTGFSRCSTCRIFRPLRV